MNIDTLTLLKLANHCDNKKWTKCSSSTSLSAEIPMSCQPPLLLHQNLQFPLQIVNNQPLSYSKEQFLYLVRNLALTTGQFFFFSSFSQYSVQPMTSLVISTSWRTLISTLNFSSSRSNLQNCKIYKKSSQSQYENKGTLLHILICKHIAKIIAEVVLTANLCLLQMG